MSKHTSSTKIEPINRDRALVSAKIESLIEAGRQETINIQDLCAYSRGSLISYMNTKKIYRTAGFLWKVGNNYFVYYDLQFENKIRVWAHNVSKMWVGSVYEVNGDLVSIRETTRPSTSYPISVDGKIIYYAKDKTDFKRFKHTVKYKLMIRWVEVFGNQNTQLVHAQAID